MEWFVCSAHRWEISNEFQELVVFSVIFALYFEPKTLWENFIYSIHTFSLLSRIIRVRVLVSTQAGFAISPDKVYFDPANIWMLGGTLIFKDKSASVTLWAHPCYLTRALLTFLVCDMFPFERKQSVCSPSQRKIGFIYFLSFLFDEV